MRGEICGVPATLVETQPIAAMGRPWQTFAEEGPVHAFCRQMRPDCQDSVGGLLGEQGREEAGDPRLRFHHGDARQALILRPSYK